jgi:hypothetical protein
MRDVFWDMTPRGPSKKNRRAGGTCHLIRAMRHHIPENSPPSPPQCRHNPKRTEHVCCIFLICGLNYNLLVCDDIFLQAILCETRNHIFV